MNIKEIQDIINFIKKTDLDDVSIETENYKIRVKKNNTEIIDLYDFLDLNKQYKYFHNCDHHWSNFGNEFVANIFQKINKRIYKTYFINLRINIIEKSTRIF